MFLDPLEPGGEAMLPATETINTFVGPMEVFAHGDIMRQYLEDPQIEGEPPYAYEAEVIDFIDRRLLPGDPWINVGANMGYFARYMAAKAGPGGRGIAVEPDPDNMALCKRNLLDLECPVQFIEGMADRDDFPVQGTLYRQNYNSGDARCWPCASVGEVPVSRFRLRDVMDFHPKVAVIDAQGMDHDVLKGMALWQPQFACIELWPHGLSQRGQNIVRVVEELVSWGYRTKVLNNDLGLYTVELEDWAKEPRRADTPS